MAVYTKVAPEDARRISEAHRLGGLHALQPIAAGSVNTNYFLDTDAGRRFLRIYEEQQSDGVRYEWALLKHLAGHGIPVPRRVPGPEAGSLQVDGKPVAVFEVVGGEQSCQAAVTPERTRQVGGMLAEVHEAGRDFGWRKEGRFTLRHVVARLDGVGATGDPALQGTIDRLRYATDDVLRRWPNDVPTGVIHGDLFRDNVHWDGNRIEAVLDWESASDGPLAYDIMVTVLAWCYGDTLHWDLARSLLGTYHARRRLLPEERRALRTLGQAAAIRFTITRITDFHLREAGSEQVKKDYRRFDARLRLLSEMSDEAVAEQLLPAG